MSRLPILLLAAVLTLTAAPAALAAEPAAVTDPAALVDPFAGTGNGGGTVGQVDTFPGADLPFGMVQWSPDTPAKPPGGGYDINDHTITGFSLTHLSGPGCAVAGDFPFLPLTGPLPADPSAAGVPFDHATESAHPGAYSVTAGGVRTELTVTPRTGLGRFTYPATDQARILVKTGSSQNGGSAAQFHLVGDREITGSVTSGHFCGQPDTYTVYFAARFDRPFTSSGSWSQGGWVGFDTRTDASVGVQTAVSYVSTAGAEANLAAEARSWSVPQVAAQAHHRWNDYLRRITIAGGTRTQQATFYTALYHCLLHPNLFSDADGRYPGFDGAVHTVQPGHAQYANVSGWDIYRTEVPLLALLAPDETGDLATSLLNDADQGGWLPKWPVANGYTGVMNGDAADPILAGAYAFGARGFDAAKALRTMVHGAEATTGPTGQGWYVERPHAAEYLANGYVPNLGSDSISPVPNGASETLEYALADFSISRLATALGQPAVADRFQRRSGNWANLFDTATGYVRPRDGDGAFPPGDPVATTGGFGQSGFQEGNAAQYTWMVPQDLRGLVDGLGGDAAAAARLDTYFSQLNAGPDLPYHWQGNEPAFGTPWVYDSLHRPWQTQQTVRRIMDSLYALGPGGEPGNDDLGAMSSWYVWSALGLYPQTPGTPLLVLGSPLFPRATLHGPHGRELTVTASGAGQTYVQRLAVDGRPSTRTWVDLDHVHRLDFTLGATPNTVWGSGPSDAPPSFPTGRPAFPPTTRAFLRVDPAQTRLAPGGSATVRVTVDNSLGTQPASVTWQSTLPTGLTARPAGATVTAPPGGSATTALTLTAGAGTPTGYYQLALTARTDTGATLARNHLLVTLAAPGETIPTAYVSNYSDNTVTPVDTRTHNAGPPISVGSGPDGMTTAAGHLYVANNNSNDVTVVDLATNAVTATVRTGAVAADVAATPDQHTVWVSDFGDGTVHPIDTSTLAVGAPVKVGAQPERLRVNPAGTELWVADQGDGTVSVVDLATRTLRRTVPVGAAPFGVAFAPDGSRAYVSENGSGTVSVIDTASYRVVATVPVGSGPEYVSVAPDGRTAYVAVTGPGGVVPIDTATATARPVIPTGGGTYALAFSPDGRTLWAVDSATNDVRPVDPATGTPGPAVTVGNVPDGIAVTG
ncbi:Alpha-1,2-mannosidase [Kitasatospora sp. MMS16-BH015]|uniref:GH92 family glycosyl hydrolase n=1 Tax=Kitasatospora sp. MMS16-BH015 TaxID=2018025 RepID=UPI000CA271C1|nr:GH92 family glycosyl hydrolase [Kitasatospora sp. MMS16-BH015]AUG75550.1 Alpha-1,2-mannosidase [Kitasatospora sp. MMS16-BH015]